MWFLDSDAAVSDPTATFVEAWIRHIEDCKNSTDDLHDHELDINTMSRTPSPSKRARIANASMDLDATPRVGVPSLSSASMGNAEFESMSIKTSSSHQSGSMSPKKRELELRQATEYPLVRREIDGLDHPTPLMQDLARLRKGAIIPNSLKARMVRESSWNNPPEDKWFLSPATSEHDSANDDYIYRRLTLIVRKTAKCKKRLSHESGWNDSVHAPLLEIAFDDLEERHVSYQSVTHCRIYPELRDPNPFLSDTKIDYAILLEPSINSLLESSLRKYKALDRLNRVAHVQLSDEGNTPVAVGIETKSKKSNSAIAGPAQLATWLRAHFRHLESLPNSSADHLPILPVIFVDGADWRVDFAERTNDQMVRFTLIL
ncbi:hypothetical protein QQZ08_004636 [Neonectria magnoliae]|uniref:PD-(D/E)XK nuclease-like domain-containing protein n=1 Tax=Neonectria magnoliae TaxID=2732573 RepID=A0ABR1I7Q2_9HYPO